MSKYALKLILLFFILLPLLSIAQDVNSLLATAQQLQKNNKEEDALAQYLQVLKWQPTNITAIVQSSELCSLIGNHQKDKTVKSSYFHSAKKYAELALKLSPTNAEANFAMSLAMGRLALMESGKQKIHAVNDIKKYAELCIKYDPNNFKGYHVLGKWHYEVSKLSSIERTAAKILFGGMPSASFEESIAYYEKSKSMAPNFNLNYLELAKVYHAVEQNDKAIALLKVTNTAITNGRRPTHKRRR
jgi:tetratricopeptide (TPR) repeat protein